MARYPNIGRLGYCYYLGVVIAIALERAEHCVLHDGAHVVLEQREVVDRRRSHRSQSFGYEKTLSDSSAKWIWSMEEDAPVDQSNQQEELKARPEKKKKATSARPKKQTKKKRAEDNQDQQQQPGDDGALGETNKAPSRDEPVQLSQQRIRELFLDNTSDSTSLLIDCNDLPTARGASTFDPGKRVPYVMENVISGEFFRVDPFGSHPSYHRLPSLSALRRSTESDLDKGSNGRCHQLLREVGLALIFMGQGILTGLLWMHAFDLTLGSSDSLVCAYGAMADQYRQLFFLLFKYPCHRCMCEVHGLSGALNAVGRLTLMPLLSACLGS